MAGPLEWGHGGLGGLLVSILGKSERDSYILGGVPKNRVTGGSRAHARGGQNEFYDGVGWGGQMMIFMMGGGGQMIKIN